MTKLYLDNGECPDCNNTPTGKYRDEMRIDGMYCKPCKVAWNVDWENQKPQYETKVPLKDWDNKSDAEQIEEILLEANAFNLREEVKREAKRIIKNDVDINEALAYEIALMKLTKQE